MSLIHDPAPGPAAERIAVVMLPGAGDGGADLVERGFVRALRGRGVPADAFLLDHGIDDYLEHGIVARLEAEAMNRARAAGHTRAWLMGISLGGLGALAYARRHPESVAGVALLAPFLGSRGLIADVTRSGGLCAWRPPPSGRDPEQELLLWLGNCRRDGAELPRIHLGFGAEDRYAPASELLAALLPAERVVRLPGGHDWETWLALWETMIESDLFAATDENR